MKELTALIYSIRRFYIKALLIDSKDFYFEADGLDEKQSRYIADKLNMKYWFKNNKTIFSTTIVPANVHILDQKLDSYLSRFIIELCIENCLTRLENCINQKVRPPNWVIAGTKCLNMDKSSKAYKMLEIVLKTYPELNDVDGYKDFINRL
ncbi:hypothetical protein [Ruminococcus albus]|uniref:hypothetical protein n=1 Tax=Ruminococcus albus TaxID=1264 RepID=UPI0004671446|nr:hypothetical protein [Ruminococcus albus]